VRSVEDVSELPDDVRILAQGSSQAIGKAEAALLIDLCLCHSIEL